MKYCIIRCDIKSLEAAQKKSPEKRRKGNRGQARRN
jgi:hypothetical protein